MTGGQAMKTEATSEPVLTPQQLLSYKSSEDSVNNVVSNAVRLWNLMQLKKPPAPIAQLRAAHARMISDLATRTWSLSDAGDDAAQLEKILRTIQTQTPPLPGYLQVTVANVRARLLGAKSTDIIANKEIGGTSNAQFSMPTVVIGPPAIKPLSGSTANVVVAVGTASPSEIWVNSFGSTPATNLAQALLKSDAYLSNPNNSPTGAAALPLIQAISNAIAAVTAALSPAGAPPNDVVTSPAYKQLQADLSAKNPNLKTIMADFNAVSIFNNGYQTGISSHLFSETVNAMALTVVQSGITFNLLNSKTNMEDLLEGSIEGIKPLYLAFAVRYALLAISGQYQGMSYNPASGTFVPSGIRGALQGSGTEKEAALSAGFGTNAPVFGASQIVVHASGGVRTTDLSGKTITLADGTSASLPALSSTTGYLGVVGLNLLAMDKEGQNVAFNIHPSGVGVGYVGNDFSSAGQSTGVNAYGYLTYAANFPERNTWRFQMFLTPQASYFAQQWRLGGQLDPLQVTHNLNPRSALTGGVTVKYNHGMKTYDNILDIAANAAYTCVSFDVVVGGGYASDKGPSTLDLSPSGWHANVGITIPLKKSK
jgi:hypothetical protein